ncbi:MAG TPA: hypothetical protein VMS17_30275 [Gemmataceae bacterium]|nr:hypothetical protein [Gemmataceae bacterium]
MMRTWTVRALVALTAAAMISSAVRATPPEPTGDEKQTQILLQELLAKMNALQASQDLQTKMMQADIEHLKAEVNRLNEEVKRLSKTTTSVAASVNPEAPEAPQLAGDIVADNRTPGGVMVFINGHGYEVPPLQQTRIKGVPGRFSYYVTADAFGMIQAPSNRNSIPGHDFLIVIGP